MLHGGFSPATKRLVTLFGDQSHHYGVNLLVNPSLDVVRDVPQHRGRVLVVGRLDLPDDLEVWIAHALSTDPLRT